MVQVDQEVGGHWNQALFFQPVVFHIDAAVLVDLDKHAG
jgi:hypothetical protein